MNFKTSLFISLILHLSIIAFSFLYAQIFQKENSLAISIQKGKSSSYNNVISFNFTGKGDRAVSQNSTIANEGSISNEIEKIRNKITYPPLALENGWETECEWTVWVGKESKIAKVQPARNCKYPIFEREFMRVINDWLFNLPEETVLKIPVTFRIQRD